MSLFARQRRLPSSGHGWPGSTLPIRVGARSGMTSMSVMQATRIPSSPCFSGCLRLKIRAYRPRPTPPTLTIETPRSLKSRPMSLAKVGTRMFSASPSTIMTPYAKNRLALGALERALGHRFRDSALLRRALTHASFANENEDVEDNEKLEFLGDSILNFLVTEKLFAAFPLEGEGTLSKARSQLVSEEHFAALERRVGLGSALLLSPGEEFQ